MSFAVPHKAFIAIRAGLSQNGQADVADRHKLFIRAAKEAKCSANHIGQVSADKMPNGPAPAPDRAVFGQAVGDERHIKGEPREIEQIRIGRGVGIAHTMTIRD
jgi:hypothetical protein